MTSIVSEAIRQIELISVGSVQSCDDSVLFVRTQFGIPGLLSYLSFGTQEQVPSWVCIRSEAF